MKVHRFDDHDLRVLATLAIDLTIDHLYYKIYRYYLPDDNYWAIECRFTHDENCFETYYDSLHINSGRDNDPTTYQMSWNTMRNGKLERRPICSPLVVVHQFEEMCKKENSIWN